MNDLETRLRAAVRDYLDGGGLVKKEPTGDA